jgi:hypothetical protein
MRFNFDGEHFDRMQLTPPFENVELINQAVRNSFPQLNEAFSEDPNLHPRERIAVPTTDVVKLYYADGEELTYGPDYFNYFTTTPQQQAEFLQKKVAEKLDNLKGIVIYKEKPTPSS